MIFLQAGTVLMFLEIIAFIVAGATIGVLPAIFLCMLSAGIGILMVQRLGLSTLTRLKASLDQGLFPMDEFFDAVCLMTAGILLILPGFLSDIIGFALLLPMLRQYLRIFIAKRYGKEGKSGSYNPDTGIIEGDFIRVKDDPDLLKPPRELP